jgi:hypothetical protein
MLGRALSLATVTLLIGCLSERPAQAQATNLEAGKSPSQIFAGTCNACHKSPRGLLKTVPAGSLQGFLRQHYTTSPEMATLLSGFLISNGAADTRYVGNQGKDAKPDAKPEARTGGAVEQLDRFGHRLRPGTTQEAARPPAEPETAREAARPEPAAPAEQPRGRNAKRLARPVEAPDGARPEGQAPAQTATEGGPEGRKSAAKQRLSRRGRAGEELPKTDATREEPARGEAAKDETPRSDSNSDTAKVESGKTGDGKAESVRIEAPKDTGGGETPVLRADPVPPVTPAPSAAPAVSASAPEPAAAPPPSPAPSPSVTAASLPPPPVAPAGPPAPPISQ